MVKYHPDTRFLTDYAAGSLPESQALCVSAHLHYCPACRIKVGELMALGTELFVTQAPATLAEDSFERLMARLEEGRELEPIALLGFVLTDLASFGADADDDCTLLVIRA